MKRKARRRKKLLLALVALVLQAPPIVIAFATHAENLLKVPLCLRRVSGGKWIHDVTVSQEDL